VLRRIFGPKEVELMGGRRWDDNIKMDLREIRWEVVDWIRFAQDRDQWRTRV
jgi:hypothetical protein